MFTYDKVKNKPRLLRALTSLDRAEFEELLKPLQAAWEAYVNTHHMYVTRFEFFYNRRHASRWSQMLDVLQVAFQADAATLLAHVEGTALAQLCPVAG
jgi:hypothetical protein